MYCNDTHQRPAAAMKPQLLALLHRHLGNMTALCWDSEHTEEGDNFILEACNNDRNCLNIQLEIRPLLPGFIGEVEKLSHGEWLTVQVPSAHDALCLVNGIIDEYLLERGSTRNGVLYFYRPQEAARAISRLRDSGKWLLCGKMPVFGTTEVIAADALYDHIVACVRADIQWRTDRREEEAAAGAEWLDDIERDYLHRRKPGIRLWQTTRLSTAACTHYLRSLEEDSAGLPFSSRCCSFEALMVDLNAAVPTLSFDYLDEDTNDQEAALRTFAQGVQEKVLEVMREEFVASSESTR